MRLILTVVVILIGATVQAEQDRAAMAQASASQTDASRAPVVQIAVAQAADTPLLTLRALQIFDL